MGHEWTFVCFDSRVVRGEGGTIGYGTIGCMCHMVTRVHGRRDMSDVRRCVKLLGNDV